MMYAGDLRILVKILNLDKFQDYRGIQTHMLLKNRAMYYNFKTVKSYFAINILTKATNNHH